MIGPMQLKHLIGEAQVVYPVTPAVMENAVTHEEGSRVFPEAGMSDGMKVFWKQNK